MNFTICLKIYFYLRNILIIIIANNNINYLETNKKNELFDICNNTVIVIKRNYYL